MNRTSQPNSFNTTQNISSQIKSIEEKLKIRIEYEKEFNKLKLDKLMKDIEKQKEINKILDKRNENILNSLSDGMDRLYYLNEKNNFIKNNVEKKKEDYNKYLQSQFRVYKKEVEEKNESIRSRINMISNMKDIKDMRNSFNDNILSKIEEQNSLITRLNQDYKEDILKNKEYFEKERQRLLEEIESLKKKTVFEEEGLKRREKEKNSKEKEKREEKINIDNNHKKEYERNGNNYNEKDESKERLDVQTYNNKEKESVNIFENKSYNIGNEINKKEKEVNNKDVTSLLDYSHNKNDNQENNKDNHLIEQSIENDKSIISNKKRVLSSTNNIKKERKEGKEEEGYKGKEKELSQKHIDNIKVNETISNPNTNSNLLSTQPEISLLPFQIKEQVLVRLLKSIEAYSKTVRSGFIYTQKSMLISNSNKDSIHRLFYNVLQSEINKDSIEFDYKSDLNNILHLPFHIINTNSKPNIDELAITSKKTISEIELDDLMKNTCGNMVNCLISHFKNMITEKKISIGFASNYISSAILNIKDNDNHYINKILPIIEIKLTKRSKQNDGQNKSSGEVAFRVTGGLVNVNENQSQSKNLYNKKENEKEKKDLFDEWE